MRGFAFTIAFAALVGCLAVGDGEKAPCVALETPCETQRCCARLLCVDDCAEAESAACAACRARCVGVEDACDPPVRDLYYPPKDASTL